MRELQLRRLGRDSGEYSGGKGNDVDVDVDEVHKTKKKSFQPVRARFWGPPGTNEGDVGVDGRTLAAHQEGYVPLDMWDFIDRPELKERERLKAYFPGRVAEPMFD